MTNSSNTKDTQGAIRSLTSTWTMASKKTAEFGFYYRWYLPKFIYSLVMADLQFIRRNNSLVYKKAGYKPKSATKTNPQEMGGHNGLN